MFSRSKCRNRRLTKAYVLDVKLSANQRRKNRLRRLLLTLSAGGVLALTVFVVWRGGEILLRRLVYENPAFAIRSLQVETDGVLSAEQIRSWAGLRLRDNLIALDLARVERDLRLVPAIESVVVERVLPNVLRIRVTEREPIAQVTFSQLRAGGAYPGGVYTLDPAGYFMFPIEVSQRAVPAGTTNDHLPLLTGIASRDIRPGHQSESPQVRAALALVQAFSHSTLAGVVDLKQIEVGTPGVLLVTTIQGSEVIFGLGDLPGQLRRWRLLHDHAQRFGKHILSLDLAVGNNSPMTWTDLAALAPLPPPKPVKASPYTKKHV